MSTRIAMFTNTYLPHVGGVARSVSAFAEDLEKLGHEVLIIAPTFPGSDVLNEDPLRVLRVPAVQNFNGSDFSMRLPLPIQIRQQLDEFRPHVLHSHHAFLLGDAALRASRAQTLPLVFTHHTLYERYTHYVPFNSKTMENFVINLSTRYANLCQVVIAPSESLAHLLKRRGVETPCYVVPTGVDTAFFGRGDGRSFRRRHEIGDGEFVLGHLGRLAPEKNLGYLARATAAYLRHDRNARFLVAGRGPSAAEIERIFDSAGCSGRLTLVGELTGKALADCYAAMDLFVFASTSETQGMVLTEAMAAGKPVIALDAPGVREVVIEGRNGRLLPRRASESEFKAAIEQFRDDRGSASASASEARRTAQRFSRESSAHALDRVYRSVLDGKAWIKKGVGDWETWLGTLKTEWALLSEKTGAAVEAMRGDDTDRKELE